MPSKVFCGHSNLRWTKKPMHCCVSPASTPNSEPSTWTTFYIFLRTGFLSWHPRISAVGIQCKRFWIEKQNSRNSWAPQAERVKFHWHPHPAEDRDLSVPHSAQAWFFFLSCVPTLLLEGLNFSTQIIQGLAKPWSMKMASVTYDCEHHLKGLRILPSWSGLKSHEAEWVTFPSSNHDKGQAYKTHPEF